MTRPYHLCLALLQLHQKSLIVLAYGNIHLLLNKLMFSHMYIHTVLYNKYKWGFSCTPPGDYIEWQQYNGYTRVTSLTLKYVSPDGNCVQERWTRHTFTPCNNDHQHVLDRALKGDLQCYLVSLFKENTSEHTKLWNCCTADFPAKGSFLTNLTGVWLFLYILYIYYIFQNISIFINIS